MAAATQPFPDPVPDPITLEEYLHSVYHPDCDYVDGYIEERNMGEIGHGLIQVELAFWFRLHKDEWNIRVISELRTRVAATRVRIPDITVAFNDGAMRESVRVTPPLLAIEILSPDDRLSRVITRLNDFLDMGIQNLWLFDPATRQAYTYMGDRLCLAEGPRLTIPNTPIYLDIAAIFSALD